MKMHLDMSLSQQLERTEARANAAFVETRARLEPESGAMWIDVGGTYAMFDGAESPITQTFGLGLFSDPLPEDFDRIESFFSERGAPTFHEVSPMSGAGLMGTLLDRGYRPIELTNVMCRVIDESELKSGNSIVTTRIVSHDEADLWARISAGGWSTEAEGLEEFMRAFGQISALCEGGYPFLGEIDGAPAATGMLFAFDEVAILAGASTLPEARRQGAQSALLNDRLRFASELGCRIATMGTLPGSQSQRNAEKNGFQVAYTRTKWMKS